VGPDKIGAQLEGSKDFAKQFMAKYNVPTAQYKSFSKETIADAFSFLNSLSAPYVLKADGLAGGKGVLIIDSIDEAKSELEKMFAGKFGTAGEKVVIEQFLSGIELSVFILTDGKDYLILPEAKDYKRIFDGDKGLNTGGMGAVSPVPFATKEFLDKVEKRIIIPTVKGLESENIKFNGFLFIGLMNCQGEPYVIEYNVRMGDPETEAVVPRIKSDLLGHLISMCRGKLSEEKIEISEIQALSVVCVSGGYPEEFKKGYEITGLEKIENGLIFHAGTIFKDGKLVTNGGRVLVLTVMENSILSARKSIYKQIMNFQFDNIHFRNDIGLDLI
jgi:phosphoribosylamine--glycine ligase